MCIRKFGPPFAAVLLAASLLAACDEGPRGNAGERLKQAETHYQAGRIRAAMIEAKNSLQIDSGSSAARFLLGRIYLDMGDGSAAEIELERAHGGGNADLITLYAGEARLMQGKYSQVLEQMTAERADASSDPAAAWTLRGMAALGLDNPAGADTAFAQALKHDPKKTKALLGAARAAMAVNDSNRALGLTEQALTAAPKDPWALIMRGDVTFAKGDYAESQKTFESVIAMSRGDLSEPSARLGLARAQIASGKFEPAIRELDLLLKSSPNNLSANYLRALAAYQTGDYATARTRIDNVFRFVRDHRPSVLLAGAVSFALGQYEQALAHLGRFVDAVPDHFHARKLLATAQLRVGHAGEAIKTLKPALEAAGEDVEILQLIGAASARAGDVASAGRYFERVVAQRPDNAQARLALGLAHAASGDSAQAIEDLETALRHNPDLDQAAIALFLTHVRSKDFEHAMALARRLQEHQPRKSLGTTLIGIAHLLLEREGEAIAAFDAALKIDPTDANARTQLAMVAVRRGQLPQAKAHLEKALEHRPKDLMTNVRMAWVEALSGQVGVARERLQATHASHPNAVLPRVFLARFHLLENKPQEALALAEPMLQANPNDPALLEVVGQAQLSLGVTSDAVRTLRTWTTVRPDSSQAHYLLSLAYAGTREMSRQLTALESAVRLNPKHVPARLRLARLLAADGKVDAADRAITEIAAAHPDDPLVLEAAGDVAALSRRYPAAVAAFKKAFERAPNPQIALKLAQVQIWDKDQPGAEKTLTDWLARTPSDLAARLQLAAMYMQTKRLPLARDHLTEAVRLAPKSVAAQNDLAWVLYRLGDLDKARTHAQRAADLDPGNPLVQDTLGIVALKQGDVARALDLLQTASRAQPKNPMVGFHLAEALAQSGEVAEAKALLKTVLANGGNFEDRAKAEELLRKLPG
jgi:putative PEP-CTERM system TPR-repeat lipoprotein